MKTRLRTSLYRRLPRALAFGLLAILPLAVVAATPAAEAIYIDPPRPTASLPAVELRTPQNDSVAAALYPPLREAFAAGRHDQARALAQSAVDAAIKAHGERDPRVLDARLNRAVVLLNQGESRSAGEQFTSLIDDASAIGGLRAPQLETAWYGLGLSLLGALLAGASSLWRAASAITWPGGTSVPSSSCRRSSASAPSTCPLRRSHLGM